MPVFPMYVDLTGKKCTVVGGGNIAARKIEILLDFCALVVVISPEINKKISDIQDDNRLKVIKKEYETVDIDDSYLVIAATSSEDVNNRIYCDALERNIPINVVDDPKKCSFIFPAIVKRGDLVIGISTSGRFPALSKNIRKRIEKIFPEEYSEIVEMLSEFRLKVQNNIQNPKERKKILNNIVNDFLLSGEDISIDKLEQVLKQYDFKENQREAL